MAIATDTIRARDLFKRAGILKNVFEMLVPSSCIRCTARTAEQGGLCPSCWNQAQFIERPYCEILGQPFSHDQGEGALSAAAIADPPPFERLRSVLVYNDLARGLVSAFKFTDRGDLAPWMAKWMAVAGRDLVADCDLVVPVPLHWRRLQSRRFNQSAELARYLAATTEKEFQPQFLTRMKPTRQQIGLSASQRARNVQGVFRVTPDRLSLVEAKRVLLIDDVYTSGATVKSCTRALKRAGAGSVDVLTFAMVCGDYI